jgi:hypothetical protein
MIRLHKRNVGIEVGVSSGTRVNTQFSSANRVRVGGGAGDTKGIWTPHTSLISTYSFVLSRVRVTTRGGFGLGIGFIDHLYTQLGTTSNYSAIANLHALQFTTAHAKSLPSACLHQQLHGNGSNSGDSSASELRFSLQPSVQNYLPYDSFARTE